jgi:mannose/fructose/N-acetylgalactosamine-specific phosphotransferase system component IIC
MALYVLAQENNTRKIPQLALQAGIYFAAGILSGIVSALLWGKKQIDFLLKNIYHFYSGWPPLPNLSGVASRTKLKIS